jgi:hypothetical protein
MRWSILLILLFFIFNTFSFAQRFEGSFNEVTDSLLFIIVKHQSEGDKYFDKGLFPSYRWYRKSDKIIKDDNIFFTQIIIFTLQKIESELSEKGKAIIQNIKSKGLKNYPAFRNSDGRITYNFWKTKPSKHFPNSKILSKSKRFKIPDDIDVTSMAYLTMDTVNTQTLYNLKSLMQTHANSTNNRIENTFKKYADIPFYSTWFGEKMPIEMDISVLTNALCLSYEFDLNFNKSDSASLLLLRDIILSKKHLTDAAYVSPSYKKRSVILYHIARLIGFYQPELLKPLIPQLVDEIEIEISNSKSAMETIILFTSLYRLGEAPSESSQLSVLENDLEYFSFFSANLASSFRNSFKRLFVKSSHFSIKYICPAYNYALLLEYLAYKHRFAK